MNVTTSPTDRRRRTALMLGVTAVAVAALLWGLFSLFDGPSQAAQSTANEEAARYADTNLLDALNEAADASSGERLAAVEELLRPEAEEEPTTSPPFFAIAGETSGSSIPVVTYYQSQDKSFMGGFTDSTDFGTACRVYSVNDEAVDAQQVDCPGNTPEHPFHDYRPALDSGNGMRFPEDMELCDFTEGELRC